MSKSRGVCVAVIVIVGLLLLVVGWMKYGHGEGGHHTDKGGPHGEGPDKAVKTDFDSYSAAIAAIEEHREHVEEMLEQKKLSELHKAAKPIQLIAEKLVGLALKEGSGVPKEKVKEVNLAAKALADTWEKIDEAGDENDLAGSKKAYQEMAGLIKTLMKFAHHDEGSEKAVKTDKGEHHDESSEKAVKTDKGGHHDEGPDKSVKTDFDSYSAAVAAIKEHREQVEKLIEHKKLSELHKAAKPIQMIAKKLVGLALKEGSGVPKEKVKEVNLAAKALANTWKKIDETGDENDLAGSKKVYQEMVGLIKTLMKFAHPVKEKHREDAHK